MFRFGLLVTLLAGLATYGSCTNLISIDGHTMVNFYSFARQFGAVTDYDSTTNTYSMSLNGTTVYAIPYSMTAWINDEQTILRPAPVIADEQLFVPMEFLLQAFHLQYTWGANYGSIEIVYQHHRCSWERDNDWGTRSHIWRHPTNFRIALNFTSSPRHCFRGRLTRRDASDTSPGEYRLTTDGRHSMSRTDPQASDRRPPRSGRKPQASGARPPMSSARTNTTVGNPKTSGRNTTSTSRHSSTTSGAYSHHNTDTSNNNSKNNSHH